MLWCRSLLCSPAFYARTVGLSPKDMCYRTSARSTSPHDTQQSSFIRHISFTYSQHSTHNRTGEHDTRHDATHDTVCCGRDNPRSYEHVDRHPTTITMQQKAQCQSEIESSNKSIVDRSSHERPNVRREDPPDGRTTSMAQATLGPYANPLQPFCSLYSARSHS